MNERERAVEYAKTLLRADYPDAAIERWMHRCNSNLDGSTPADAITLGRWRDVIAVIHKEQKRDR